MRLSGAVAHLPPSWRAHLRSLWHQLGLLNHSPSVTRLYLEGPAPKLASPHAIPESMALCMVSAALAATTYGGLRGIQPQQASLTLHTALAHVHAEHMFGPTLNGRPLASRLVRDNPLLATPYLCADGQWLMPSALHPQALLAWLRLLGTPPTWDAIAQAFASRTAGAAETMASASGLAAAVCNSQEAWRQHPQGQWLSAQNVVQLRAQARITPKKPTAAARPLHGVRVLLLTQGIAGPLVGRTLAEQGADVLHLGHPEGFEHEAVWCEAYVGCKSMGLDLRGSQGAACADALMAQSDVLVCSLQTRAQQALGLDEATLKKRHPHLVQVQLSAYGSAGPYAGRPGFDMNAMAATGMMRDEGLYVDAGGPPRLPPTVLLNDFLMGYLGAAAACAALVHRATTGQVYAAELSLCRLAMWCQDLQKTQLAAEALPLGKQQNLAVIKSATPLGNLRRLAPGVCLHQTPGAWREPMLVPRVSLPASSTWPV